MRKLFLFILAVFMLLSACQMNLTEPKLSQTAAARSTTAGNVIRPNHISQNQMDIQVSDYYDQWLNDHVQASNSLSHGYYVYMVGVGPNPGKTTSEAHGYGMLITALMEDKYMFDGMYKFFDAHRSTTNGYLMSWTVTSDENPANDTGSATDGDMDIAYALLLAHDKWGSDGEINYLAEAIDMITYGIKVSDMSPETNRVMLGDWDTNSLSTRASDWMTGHFNAYYNATGDNFWNDASGTAFWIIDQIRQNYSWNTGLMPDFVVGATPEPAPEWFLNEFQDTDEYNWNACRFPLRMAADYAHYGTADAKTAVSSILNWLKPAVGYNPAAIMAGYSLDGSPLTSYSSPAFTAPLVAAAITDSAHQSFLNAGWDILVNTHESYYGDSITLLSMLLISGKWSAPGSGDDIIIPDDFIPAAENIALGKNAVASSLEPSSAHYANNVTDGVLSSRWASEYADNQWVYVDLGATYKLEKVELIWEGAYASVYQIQTSSDALNWTSIYWESAGNGSNDQISLEQQEGRYLRILCTQRATEWGNSLYEFRVAGIKTNDDIIIDDPLVSQNKPVTTSSVESGSSHTGDNANDGDESSRWASATTDDEWITIDLRGYYDISKVSILWEAAFAAQYEIKTSTDGINWTTIVTENSGAADRFDYSVNTNTRYVGVQGVSRGTPWGYSIYEFSVFGKKTADIDDDIIPEPKGWDFQDHTYNHPHLNQLSEWEIRDQFNKVNADFAANGLPEPKHIAYPFGSQDALVRSITAEYRDTGRLAWGTIMEPSYPIADKYQLTTVEIQGDDSAASVKGWIDQCIAADSLMQIFTHKVISSGWPTQYETTTTVLAEVLDYLVEKQNAGELLVLPVSQAYDTWNGSKAVVIVAFDDGFQTDYYNAWPLFKERGLVGTSYIATGVVGTGDYMSWDMIKEMAGSEIEDPIDTLKTNIFFDDFSYNSVYDLDASSWYAREGTGGPGAGGCYWEKSNVEFVSDGYGGKLMRLHASTSGYGASSSQAQVTTDEQKFYEGTYAARIRFTDTPAAGGDGDQIVETFYTITPLDYDWQPDYAEVDFEYLANGGWGKDTGMWMSSWETYGASGQDVSSTTAEWSHEGWHTVIFTIADGSVNFYIDGVWRHWEGGEYYPEQHQTINFNLWFIDGGFNGYGSTREYIQDVDWVYHIKDEVLSHDEVMEQVNLLKTGNHAFYEGF